jgi:hypothetical protein
VILDPLPPRPPRDTDWIDTAIGALVLIAFLTLIWAST